MPRPLLTLLAIVSILLVCSMPVAAKTLALNDVGSPPLTNDRGTGFLDIIATEAFRRNGLKLSLIRVPAERALKNSNAGIDDGELFRIGGMEKLYPNLVPVPEKIIDMHFVAFSKDPSVRVNGWQSLGPLVVGLIKGWKILEINTPREAHIILARDAEQLFTMLDKGRVDVALYSRLMGLEIIRRRKIAGAKALSPPLDVRAMFIFLHKKHKALAPKIAASLAALKSEGVYGREYRKMEAALVAAR